nr:MAG TPA: prohead serine protease [Caudoviricetes sp.]
MKKATLAISPEAAQVSPAEGDEWRFSGHASVFNSTNDRGFSFSRGAFSDVVASGTMPKMFFNHDTQSVPVGKWLSMTEDDAGLFCEGVLSQRVSSAADLHGALLDGLVDGLSVSVWWNEEDEATDPETGAMQVTKVLAVPEISLVTYPADPGARVEAALSADDLDARIDSIHTLKDFEGFARDAARLSRRQAKAIVASVKTAVTDQLERDARAEKEAALKRLAEAVAKL